MMTEGEITRAWQKEVRPDPVPADIRTKPLPWRPFATPAGQWLNGDNLPFPRTDDEMRGTYIARQSMKYLDEAAAAGQPFALWCSLQEPHSPFDFPIEDRALMDPKKFAVPRVGPEDAWQVPLIFRDLSPEAKQGIIAAYYTSAAFMDRNFGRVLKKLRDLRLDENTLIVYTADHGYCLGQHGRFEKHCGYDSALRVPLIMQPARSHQAWRHPRFHRTPRPRPHHPRNARRPAAARPARAVAGCPTFRVNGPPSPAPTSSASTWKTRRSSFAQSAGSSSTPPASAPAKTATRRTTRPRAATPSSTTCRRTPANSPTFQPPTPRSSPISRRSCSTASGPRTPTVTRSLRKAASSVPWSSTCPRGTTPRRARRSRRSCF